MDYYVKEINSCESKILDKIDIIKRFGAEVSEYENELQQILSKIDNDNISFSSNTSSSALKLKNESNNREVLNKLINLENKLESYESYLKIHFRNSSLINEIENKATDEKIDLYVKEAKSLIKEVENININSVNNLKKIIKEVYSTIYEIIKLELIKNGKSELLTYIVTSGQGIEYINDLVRENINKLKEDKLLDSEISNLIDELSKEGINYTYASEKLILALTLKNKDLVLSKIDEQFDLYEERIKELKNKTIELEEDREKIIDTFKKYEHKKNKSRKKAIISSIILALNLMSYKFMPSITKSINTTTTYKLNREAYDTINRKVTTDENTYGTKDESEYAELKYYSEVDKNGRRTVTTFKFDNKNVEDISDYIYMFSETDGYSTRETIDYRFSEQLSREEYTVVERMTYGEEKVEFDEEKYQKDLQRALLIINILGGVFGTSLLHYLLITIHNNRKYKEELEELTYTDRTIEDSEHKIEKYKKLKNELIELKKDYEDDGLNTEDYKKILRK